MKYLRESKGNMYPWVGYTWNPVAGKCPHNCAYCYMKNIPSKKYQGEPRLHKAINANLGRDNVIFVGSANDVFADTVPSEVIRAVIERCKEFPENTYLFQSKNPARFDEFVGLFPQDDEMPKRTILGTTIESNRDHGISEAPTPQERFHAMTGKAMLYRVMISVEPILDFDVDELVRMLSIIKPSFVSIGADSKGHGLSEPSAEKINRLVEEVREFAEVKPKKNLARLVGEDIWYLEGVCSDDAS